MQTPEEIEGNLVIAEWLATFKLGFCFHKVLPSLGTKWRRPHFWHSYTASPAEPPYSVSLRPSGPITAGAGDDELQFHRSWDWLMPVIKKLAEENGNTIPWAVGLPLINTLDVEKVWQGVITFIKDKK